MTLIFERAFSVAAPRLRNSLPVDIETLPRYTHSKRSSRLLCFINSFRIGIYCYFVHCFLTYLAGRLFSCKLHCLLLLLLFLLRIN